MSDKLESGFVADGPGRYAEGLDAEFRRQFDDLQRRLLDPNLDSKTRLQLTQELEKLEREYEEKKRGIDHSLF